MQYTSNYNLKKIDLTDSPPDITQLNGNFDVIDSELTGHTERLDAQEVREIDIWASINALGDKVTTPFCVNSGSLDANGLPNILGYANDNNTSTELAFQQPVLTANGTMGGSAFAVSANDSAAWAWYLFSANGGEWGGQSAPSESNPTELQIYNPTPLLVRSISLKNSVTVEQIWSRAIVYGSNNGSTWTQIATGNNSIRTTGTWVDLAVNATVSYKYFKISFTGNTTGAAIAVARISLNATQTITHTGGRVTFKGSIVATTATGKTFTVGSMADIDVSKLTGREFIAFIDTAGATGVTAGTMYAQDTQPTSPASGDIWFKTLEPLACYQYLANTWRERNIVPIGEVYADGTGKITGVSTYPYNQNGYTVNTRTTATASTFGLVRTAAPEDETNCQCDDAAVTPENLYKLANYRLVNTEYAIGDVVACPYHAELQLKCTTAGTTGAEALDTTAVTAGQVLVDGGVNWTVESTAYAEATTSAAGLMSAADKKKLDGIAAGAGGALTRKAKISGTIPKYSGAQQYTKTISGLTANKPVYVVFYLSSSSGVTFYIDAIQGIVGYTSTSLKTTEEGFGGGTFFLPYTFIPGGTTISITFSASNSSPEISYDISAYQ